MEGLPHFLIALSPKSSINQLSPNTLNFPSQSICREPVTTALPVENKELKGKNKFMTGSSSRKGWNK